MSANRTAAEKAAIAISDDHEGWTGTGLDLKLAAGVIEAAIDEQTKPLVEALRAADSHLMNVPIRPGIIKLSQHLEAALAPFEVPKGGGE